MQQIKKEETHTQRNTVSLREMGRNPRCTKDGLNKGAWTALEDKILIDHVKTHGEGKWSNLAKETGQRESILFDFFISRMYKEYFLFCITYLLFF